MTTINVRLEKALHKALKKTAIDEGFSMEEGAIRGIKWFVSKDLAKVEGEEEEDNNIDLGESENAF